MADVFNRTDGRYLQSVNTPDFNPANWIINPNLSAVAGQPVRYWIIDPPGSDTIRLATAGEQAAIDAARAAASDAANKETQKNNYDLERILQGMVLALIDEVNLLRQQFNTTTGQVNAIAPTVTATAFTDRTPAQARTAIRNKVDSL